MMFVLFVCFIELRSNLSLVYETRSVCFIILLFLFIKIPNFSLLKLVSYYCAMCKHFEYL